MKSGLRHTLLTIFLTVRFGIAAHAYGPLGHEIVGAIADERLANTPTGTKIYALLDGFTLEKAAVITDEIKGWDKKGVDDPRSFHYSAHRNIDRQLRDFWRANPPTPGLNPGAPSHHWFHYTDVPVVPAQRYRDGSAGRSKWDIVHVIPFCIQVLQGRVPEQNERKITKPVALILLAHYVADIHQPLHVGAEYFDQQGRVVDPDKDKSALGDEGGNTFTLELIDEPPRGRGIHKKKLHGFWDYDAVNALFPQVPGTLRKSELQALIEPHKRELVHEMATHEPNRWRMRPGLPVDGYAEIWADEILPVAGEAYARLQFTDVHSQQERDRVVAAGEAVEKPIANQMNYRTWATGVVRQELHKAGWRLADLLEKIL
ncbi:MAG TPA: S1/P1 nuclease [Candidatus Udaeobacter sp.]|jgi:S1/P1 nuclease|nr:S1/P1 nuclease [Candidatus Udaeobacter sp.]